MAEAVARLGLAHAVVTTVARDDLADGGAAGFAATVAAIRRRSPGTAVEVLISDCKGDPDSLATIFAAGPDVLNHNLETVPRLQRAVRPSASYARSLAVLARAKAAGLTTKSGLIVGMGETRRRGRLHAGRPARRRASTSSPSASTCGRRRITCRWPVGGSPRSSSRLAAAGEAMGIPHVEASPLTRSSYHARQAAAAASPACRRPALAAPAPARSAEARSWT